MSSAATGAFLALSASPLERQMKGRPVALPRNPGELLFCGDRSVQRGQGTGRSHRGKLPAWKQRREGTNGFSSNSAMGLLLLRDFFPAELSAQPALRRAPEHQGHRLKPSRSNTAAAQAARVPHVPAPIQGQSRTCKKEWGVCVHECEEGSNTPPQTKVPRNRGMRVAGKGGAALCVVWDKEGGRTGRGGQLLAYSSRARLQSS